MLRECQLGIRSKQFVHVAFRIFEEVLLQIKVKSDEVSVKEKATEEDLIFPARFSFFKFLDPLSIEVLCDEMLSSTL